MPAKITIEEQVLVDLISLKKTCSEITKELNISKSCLYRNLREYGLSLDYGIKFNNTIFDIIDSEEKSYWLGFLYADGYVSNGKYNNSIELSLKGEDIEHVKKFQKFLEDTTSEIKLSRSTGDFTRCRYLVTDKHFRNRLISLGCTPNKSLSLSFPPVEIFSTINLVYPFIRGYIDGDGCLSRDKNGRLQISVIGTKEFLTGIMNIFPEFKSLHSTRSSKIGKNNFSLDCSANKADSVANKLYENATIYLERKYNKFAELRRNS